jgi:hypothetical protein
VDENWNRYHDNLLKEDQEAIERQKRVDALSTERMEYEMYRSTEPDSRKNSLIGTSEAVQKGASRRKRPAAARWSTCYSDTSSSLQPLTSTNEEEEEEGEYQEGHDGHHPAETDDNMPAGPNEEEEDNYEDIQPEEHLPEDEEDSTLIMKPDQEEEI